MNHEVHMAKHGSRKPPNEFEDQQKLQAKEALGAGSQRGSSIKERREIPDAASFK